MWGAPDFWNPTVHTNYFMGLVRSWQTVSGASLKLSQRQHNSRHPAHEGGVAATIERLVGFGFWSFRPDLNLFSMLPSSHFLVKLSSKNLDRPLQPCAPVS